MRRFAVIFSIAMAAPGCTDRCFIEGLNCENIDPPQGFSALALGRDHSCGLRRNYEFECWGTDHAGSTLPRTGIFSAIAAGDRHTCALDVYAIACWGDPSLPQVQVPLSNKFGAVVAGAEFTCGAASGGTGSTECWGDNTYGQTTPPNIALRIIAAGREHACGTASFDGGVRCWGRNDAGQAPASIAGDFVALTAGDRHTCGLAASGAVTCWGEMPGGIPPPAIKFRRISAGSFHTCGITMEDLRIVCWGDDSDGQASPPAGRFEEIASGPRHSCAITERSDAICWGANDAGQGDVP